MKEIVLANGRGVALVDDADFARLGHLKWHLSDGYAMHSTRKNGKPSGYSLHRAILNFPTAKVDHRNRDKLDCRRSNLRIASDSDNARNRSKPRSNKSGFVGVSWDKSASKWLAQIQIMGKTKHIGRFSDKIDAAKAYDEACCRLFGNFAVPNFGAP